MSIVLVDELIEEICVPSGDEQQLESSDDADGDGERDEDVGCCCIAGDMFS